MTGLLAPVSDDPDDDVPPPDELDDIDPDLAAALMGRLDTEVAADRVALRRAVARQIFCPISGRVLDVDSAVLVQLLHPGGGPASHATVYTGEAWDDGAPRIRAFAVGRGLSVHVVDGRTATVHRASGAVTFPAGAPCFKVEAGELKAALRHLARIGDNADRLTLSALGPGLVELAASSPMGTAMVQAVSRVAAHVAMPGRVVLCLSEVRHAAKQDPAAPLLVDVDGKRAELGATELSVMTPVPVPDGPDPAPMLRLPIRDFARATATAARLPDPGSDQARAQNLWLALHPDTLTIVGTDRYRLAEITVPGVRLPFAPAETVQAHVPPKAGIAAGKMARSGHVEIGSDGKLTVLSAGPHKIRIWHPTVQHPSLAKAFPAEQVRYPVRAGDLAEAWTRAVAEAKRLDAEAVTVHRKSSGRIAAPDAAVIRAEFIGASVRLTVEAPELRHYNGNDPKPLGDVDAGRVPGEHPGPKYRQIALAPWSFDAVLHQTDPDATLVLALPADPGSRLLMVYAVGERHTTTTVLTRGERMTARTEWLIAENARIRAALAATDPRRETR